MQPLLHWKSKKYYICWVCVCSLRHPACNAHVPYCHLRPVRLYNIFLYYPKNGPIFEKVIENDMCVLIFSTTFVWNIYHSKENWTRYDKNTHVGVHVKYPLFLSHFNKTSFFSTHSEYIQISNFMKIRSVRANSCFSKSCEVLKHLVLEETTLQKCTGNSTDK